MEQVTSSISEELRHAIECFIRTKRSLNDRDPKPEGFEAWKDSLPREHFIDQRGGDYACWPTTTLAAILPFFDNERAPDSRPRPARVPVRRLLGSSYKWSENIRARSGKSIEENIQFFTDDERATTSWEHANVRLIRQLGMFYVAGEGKNRVAFLARHGQEWMPCKLDEQDYIAADKLQLLEVREGPQRTWLCVNDDRHAELIAYPELTIPLLKAYGVRMGQWSAAWPMKSTVMNSFRLQEIDYSHLDGSRSVPSGRIDLHHLVQRETDARSPPRQPSFSALLRPQLGMPRRWVFGIGAGLLLLSMVGYGCR